MTNTKGELITLAEYGKKYFFPFCIWNEDWEEA